jgi:Caspase domain/Lipase (class 3)
MQHRRLLIAASLFVFCNGCGQAIKSSPANDRASLNWEVPLKAASICNAVYLDVGPERDRIHELGFTKYRGFQRESIHAIVCSSETVVVVGFRGTAQLADWAINVDERRAKVADGEIHLGFYEAMKSLYADMLAEAKAQGAGQKAVWVTGHSLGGAMAVAFAYESSSKGDLSIDSLITFGQPLLLNRPLAEYMNSHFESRFRRFVNGSDIVTRLIPTFHHAGSRVHLTTDDFEVLPPAVSYRDLNRGQDLQDSEALSEEEFQALKARLKQNSARNPPGEADEGRGFGSWLHDHSMDLYEASILRMKDSQSRETQGPKRRSASETQHGGHKKAFALLVGINNYADPEIPRLHGCLHDIERMKDLLTKDYAFDPSNITTLPDKLATRGAILDAFQKTLIDKADSETVVVFHYSGHGSQVPDKDGHQPNGLDSTIVPYDSTLALDTQRDITATELYGLLQRLRAKTMLITVILDCCHSGDGTRDIDQPRDIRHSTNGLELKPKKIAGASGHPIPDYAAIEACESKELAFEVESPVGTCGALTHCLIEAVRSPQSGRPGAPLSYQDLKEQVQQRVSTIKPRQHPVLDGTAGNRQFLGSARLATERYVLIKEIDEKTVKLDGGRVHGLTPRSLLDVYPPGTTEFQNKDLSVARIRLTEVGAVASTGVIEAVSKYKKVEPLCRGVVRLQQFENTPFTIWLDPNKLPEAFIDKFKPIVTGPDFPMPVMLVGRDDRPRITIRQMEPQRPNALAKRYAFLEGDGTEIFSLPIADNGSPTAAQVGSSLIDWIRWYRTVELANPAEADKLATLTVTGARPQKADVSAGIQFAAAVGDQVEFTVTSQSDDNLYFALLDCSNDGSIGVIEARASGKPLAPHKTYSFKTPTSIPPGDKRNRVIDNMLLVVTQQPTDFRFLEQDPIIRAKDLDDRAPKDPLALLLAHRRFGGRQVDRPVIVTTWSTDTKRLEVLK